MASFQLFGQSPSLKNIFNTKLLFDDFSPYYIAKSLGAVTICSYLVRRQTGVSYPTWAFGSTPNGCLALLCVMFFCGHSKVRRRQ